jgi:iron complex outermembrane receptor protein
MSTKTRTGLFAAASSIVVAMSLAAAGGAQAQSTATGSTGDGQPAFSGAQPPTPTPEAGTTGDNNSGDELVVTGSRIRRPNLESNSPLTVVGSEEIQLEGAVNVESVLNRLPQVTADANENVSNGSDGTARVNLRNLGSNRNLVLLNGQRLLPLQANDLNFIPAALVQRVDVVTGGASAVYGSDAISGVVNFILRDHLNGVRLDAQYGFAQHRNDNDGRRDLIDQSGYENAPGRVTDGQKIDVNIAAGANFAQDRGNITAYFGFRDVKPIMQGDRDVSACALDPNGTNTDFVCGGSSNNQYGLFAPLTGPSAGQRLNNTKDGEKTWVPYGPAFVYNYAPLNYFQRNDRRYTAGVFAKYEIIPQIEAYGSFMFMDDHTNSQVAPSALFQGTIFNINCDNPLLSAQQGGLLCGSDYGSNTTENLFIGYRPVAGAARPRRDDLRHTDYRITGGFRGKLNDAFSYDINGLHSIVQFHENYQNDIDPVKANRGLQVVNVNGTPTCKSVIDGTDPKCVPLDVFAYNGISQAGFDYIYAPTFTEETDTETVFNATLNGDFGKYGITSPWAEQGLGVAIGTEYRRETLDFRADQLAQQKGTLPVSGSFHVTEFYAEAQLPLVQNKPGIESLTVNGGYRLSNYSNLDDNVSTYKVELAYSPVHDIRLRASYNRAIRSPSISELFAPQIVGNVSAIDPCAGENPQATLAQCQLTGVTPQQYGHITPCPTDVCSAKGGGNEDLKPETADTYTVGVVLMPRMIPRLSLSVDYFNIKVKDYISSVPASLIVSQCFSTGDPFFCGLFHRNPAAGGVIFGTDGYLQANTQNTGSLKTSGIDFGGNYSIKTDRAGDFDISFIGTWLHKLENEPLPGLGSYDCTGLFGPTCGQPNPEWRHQARVTWQEPFWHVASLSLNWRYIGSTSLTNNTSDPFLTGPHYDLNSKIKAYNYFDLTGTAKIRDGVVLRVGVNNLFDRDPPAIAQGLLSSFGNGNTYPGVYDVVGRSVFMGVTAEF